MINSKKLEKPISNIKESKGTIKLNMNMIIVAALAILVFVSVIQTVTLASLINKKSAGADNSNQRTNSQTTAEGKSDLPAALKDVPQQVGGC